MFNNTDTLERVKPSVTTFSSLAGFISNHAKSVNSNTTEISSQHSINTQPFSSLAALTAHHLQNSNTDNDTKFHEMRQLPSSQFVIPKLLSKKSNSERTQVPKSSNNENKTIQLTSTNSLDKYPIDLLENNLSKLHILSKNDITTGKLEAQLKPMNVTDDMHTLSSENWAIDLSTALKEAELLTDRIVNNPVALRKLYDKPNLDLRTEDKSDMVNLLPISLNSCALRSTKLPYTKKNVSMFGRTLCREWKAKRSILKILV